MVEEADEVVEDDEDDDLDEVVDAVETVDKTDLRFVIQDEEIRLELENYLSMMKTLKMTFIMVILVQKLVLL